MEQETTYIACSECFSDTGLKLDAIQFGTELALECPNCHSGKGRKLDYGNLYNLTLQFFVSGASFKTKYGGAPAIQFNEYHLNKDTINVSDWLKSDVKLIGQLLKVGFFHYGPRLWTVGEIEPLIALQNEKTRGPIIQRIITEFPKVILSQGTSFFRVRKDPVNPAALSEFDTPPEPFLGSGRLDTIECPVFYASQDLEACIHEYRVTLEDRLYVANLSLKSNINVIDLTEWIPESGTEFESLNLSVQFLFSAANHAYEILREVAQAAYSAGFDGILYPSYYTHVHRQQNETIKNIGLFGRPISDGILKVDCVNRVMLKKVSYDLHFGPADF